VPQITTAEEPPAIPIKLFDPFTFYRNLWSSLFYETEGILI
jgi:hypothetical protein